MPLSTIFQLYPGGQFYFVEETEVPLVKPTTELLEVIDKLCHVIVYRVLYTVYLVMNGIQTLSGNRLQT